MSAQKETISARGSVLQFSSSGTGFLSESLASTEHREAKCVQKTRQGEVYWRIWDSFFALCSPHVLVRNNWSITKQFPQWFKHQQSTIRAPDSKCNGERTASQRPWQKDVVLVPNHLYFLFFLAHRNKKSCLRKHIFSFLLSSNYKRLFYLVWFQPKPE